jgi:hypothetical protein
MHLSLQRTSLSVNEAGEFLIKPPCGDAVFRMQTGAVHSLQFGFEALAVGFF